MNPEPILHRLGSTQHALVLHRQLLAAGLTARQVDDLLASERVIPEFRGVYRLSGAPVTWDQQMLAAALYTGGPSSHRGSALLWGVDLGPMPPREIAVFRSHAPRPPGVVVHRSLDLDPAHIVRRRGIPVTNPLRMLVDLGAVVGHEDVETALDSLLSRRIVTIAGVRAFREKLGGRGRRGAGVLGEVLDNRALAKLRADSLLEPMMARLCRARGLVMPDFQVWVRVRGKWFRMDFAYPSEMVNIEVDGYEHHGGKYQNWLSDLDRDAELTAMGWQVLRFPREAIRHRPANTARIITDVLGRRCRLAGAA